MNKRALILHYEKQGKSLTTWELNTWIQALIKKKTNQITKPNKKNPNKTPTETNNPLWIQQLKNRGISYGLVSVCFDGLQTARFHNQNPKYTYVLLAQFYHNTGKSKDQLCWISNWRKILSLRTHSPSLFKTPFPHLLIIRFFVSLQPFNQILMLSIKVSDCLAVVFQQLPGRTEKGQTLIDWRERSKVLLTWRLRTSMPGWDMGGCQPGQKQFLMTWRLQTII